ncbi:hypothetical protein [Streptomyces sp. TE33382]
MGPAGPGRTAGPPELLGLLYGGDSALVQHDGEPLQTGGAGHGRAG